MTLNRPSQQPCARTHARIIAHCSIRHGVSVGTTMRELVGRAGDITALPTSVLASRFAGIRLEAALHNRWIVEYGKAKRSKSYEKEEES